MSFIPRTTLASSGLWFEQHLFCMSLARPLQFPILGCALIAAFASSACLNFETDRCSNSDLFCAEFGPLLYTLYQPTIITGATVSPTVGTSFWKVSRLDGDGTALWTRNLFEAQGATTINTLAEVRVTDDGALAIYGSSDSGGGGDHYLFKYSLDGLELWQRTWGQPGNETPAAADVDAAGNIYALGDFNNGANTDWWIKKFDANGVEDTIGWNKVLNGTANMNDAPASIHVSTDGSIYVSGGTDDGAGNEGAIRKYLPDGTEVTAGWNKRFGTTIVCSASCTMAADAAGNLYVAATINTGDNDWYLRKFSPDGTEFSGNFPVRFGFAGGADQLFAISMGVTGDLYLVGSIDPTASAAQLEGQFLRLDLDGNYLSNYRTNVGSETDNYVGVGLDRFGRAYFAGGVSDTGGAAGFDRSLIRLGPRGELDGNINWRGGGVDAGFSLTDFFLSLDVQ